jgi:CheY-like chemotaxis protein
MENTAVARDPEPLREPEPVKLLLVDDRPTNLLALEAVLDNRGYEIVTASSGREAVASVLSHDFAVILLDVMMPEMRRLQNSVTHPRGRGGKKYPNHFCNGPQ